jgi:hypothetical protein
MAHPLQNRVDPFGRLHAVSARGAWMGNRGVLHNAKQEIVAPWRGKRWITCVLDFRGRQRKVFSPGRYSELFFLDEATAYAAGHRPCAECRRPDYNAFRDAWGGGSADDIDAVLHQERTTRTHEAALRDLPIGAFFEHEDQPYIVSGSGLRRWTFEGYWPAARLNAKRVRLLTPPSIVRLFRGRLSPQIHASGAQARQAR